VEKVSFEPGMKYVNVMEGDSGEQVEDDRWIRECDIISLFVCLFVWGLTTLSAQIGYITP